MITSFFDDNWGEKYAYIYYIRTVNNWRVYNQK